VDVYKKFVHVCEMQYASLQCWFAFVFRFPT